MYDLAETNISSSCSPINVFIIVFYYVVFDEGVIGNQEYSMQAC